MSDGQTANSAGIGGRAQASLTISADVHFLIVIRQFVEAAAGVMQVNPALVPDLIQAVDESSSNIILHGYRGGPGQIEVEISSDGGALSVALRDTAPLFDPTRLPEPDVSLPLNKRTIGGLGVFITRKLVDEVRYRERDGGGNEFETLIKRRERARGNW